MAQEEFDSLEHYLEMATVVDVAAFSHTTAHHSFRLILEGGVTAIAKPADTAPEGVVMCKREAAAWIVARALGWTDLVSTTVMRLMTSPDSGEEVETSAQVIWADYLPDAPLDRFSDEDLWRAAVFDLLVGHSDRGGHNWLAVPGSGTTSGLKLVDHGYAFPETTAPPSSSFYELRKGQDLPDDIVGAVDGLLSRPPEVDRLYELLSPAAADAIAERAEAILGDRVLGIQTP